MTMTKEMTKEMTALQAVCARLEAGEDVQGLTEITYREADDASQDWVARSE